MGQDKALLQLPDGRRMLEKTVAVAQMLTPDVTIVTPWPERYQPLLSTPIHWLEDTREEGPLAGFAQAWADMSADWCLLLACDLPNLEANVLQQWWHWLTSEQAPEGLSSTKLSSPVTASLVKGRKGWEPLCGYYHRRCTAGLNRHLNAGDRDFQSWLPALQIAPYLSVPDEMLFNCNRPADWAKLTA